MLSKSRIRLRKINANDVSLVYEWFSIQDFFYSTKRPNSLSMGMIKNKLINTSQTYYIIENENRKPIGLCDFKVISDESRDTVVELRLVEDQDWVKYGLDSWLIFLKLLFVNFNFHRITKYLYQFDSKSRWFCEKIGFTREGIMEEFIYTKAKYYNCFVYGMLKRDFNELVNNETKIDIFKALNFEIRTESVLHGRKINLRRLEEKDIGLLYKWENTKEVYMNISDEAFDNSYGDYRINRLSNLNSKKETEIHFIIESKKKKPIGIVSLIGINLQERFAGTITLIGEKDFLGLGYGPMAEQILFRFAFHELNLHRLYGISYGCNEKVRKTAIRKKFKYSAVFKNSIYKDGKYYDSFVADIMRSENSK